jgi:hypothetical protein
MIDARDIARGARSEYHGFKMLPRANFNICHETYLMQSTGWKSINFTGMLWDLCTSVLVILLAIPSTKEIANVEVDVLSICRWLWAFGKWLRRVAHQIWDLIKWMWQHNHSCLLGPVMQTMSRIFIY